MDWDGVHFVHQEGNYVLGKVSKETKASDTALVKPLWKDFQNGWILNGEYAYKTTKKIAESGNDTSIGVAGQLTNGIWFPVALLSQILWDCDKPYNAIFEKVINRRSIDFV